MTFIVDKGHLKHKTPLLDYYLLGDSETKMVQTCVLQKRYQNVEEINLEFAQGVEDKHLTSIASKVLNILLETQPTSWM